ncbi:MAG: transporter permease [Herminiimonas sp.]|nr:transporter permease [Herminiimonas sp.]
MSSYITTILIVMSIYVLLALALDLQYGFTGLINFGVVGFFGVGAYTTSLLTLKAGWPAWLSFPAAMVIAGALSWPIGRIALKLRDDYLAIVTLGFSEIIRLIIVKEEWLTNGVQGVSGVPRLWPTWTGKASELFLLGALIAANVITALVMRRITQSPYGRTIQAIRDDEVAVTALGKSPSRFKTQVLVIGGAIAGLAGAFYAHYITYVVPDQFMPLVTFYVWIAIIMGGVARLLGSISGAILLVVLLEGSRFLRGVIPGVSDVAMASVQLGVVGLLLILFMRWRPQGLFGQRSAN